MICQLQWDETKFRLHMQGDRHGDKEVSTLACHGRLLVSRDGRVEDDELVVPPCAIEATSADAMWAGLEQVSIGWYGWGAGPTLPETGRGQLGRTEGQELGSRQCVCKFERACELKLVVAL